ncbi:PREDICTED: uncharacterized protein LOC109477702 [Branchiostoma belcheri]|uniref:Uncharacterized protein LOC109477702 n=1 Tax=Branchiostoma belcheri TaxID=7741 RepID=A0A6P4ZYD7_BRABE|nr:PREDICTED: uncharacterized protein LOC109477702 [Branchiostoma belcheri]
MDYIMEGLRHGHTSLSEWQSCSEVPCTLCLSYLQHVINKSRNCKQGCKLCAEVCKRVTNHWKTCTSGTCHISLCQELRSSFNATESDVNRNEETQVTIEDIRPLVEKILSEETQEHKRSIVLPELYAENQGVVEDVTHYQTDKDTKKLLARGGTEGVSAIDMRLNNLSLGDVQSTPGIRNIQERDNIQTPTNQFAIAAYLDDTNQNVTREGEERFARHDLPPGVLGPPTYAYPLSFPTLSDFSRPGLGYVAKGTPSDIKVFSQYWASLAEAENQDQEEGVLFHEDLTPINGRYTKNTHWRLGHKIGGGEQGCCYLTVDHMTEFICAVKQVSPPGYRAEEIEIWGELVHPRINRMYGILRDKDFYYFMEYIYGDNIVVTEKGEAIVLIDFGLACQLPHNVSAVPRGEPATGTYAYQSPEVRFRLGHDCKADVWSAVCVLYSMLEGVTPAFDFKPCEVCLLAAFQKI